MIIRGDERKSSSSSNNSTNGKKLSLKDERGIIHAMPKYIRWFSELSYNDVPIAGGKGANLGEMYKNNFPVPPGFVIIASAYSKFLEVTGLDNEIYSKLSRLDPEKTEDLEEVAREIQRLIIKAEMPKDMEEEILESYSHLNVDENALKGASNDALAILKKGREPPFVAVRSSATAEDSADASFAGQNSTFLNTKGNSDLITAVKGCWASLFTARSVYYRIKKGFKHETTAIAVVIQMMVNPEKSGVMFTKDPVKNTNNVVIEAVYGLGEGIVSGMINPDHYEVTPEEEITNARISEKKIAIVRNSSGRNETVPLTKERGTSQVLSGYEIKRLSQYGLELENHYKKPQDIEFAVDSGRIYIVQTRPITTLEKRDDYEKKAKENEISGEAVLTGISASPGVGNGPVKIVMDLNELSKIKKGDVLVTPMTNPDMVVAMQKASAILTDEGGLTSHAAIVSREMGIPCVVGSRIATKTFHDGEIITIDGYTGRVYRGVIEGKKVEIRPIVPTKTHIKVIVDLPDYAERAALTKSDAVGLTRMEGIIAEGGRHPQGFLKNDDVEKYEEIIYRGVKKIAEHFKEVWVRTSDIRSDEYEHLEGAPKWHEANPMLGMHGIRASLKYPELLKAELRALRRVAEEGKTIGVMMPQIISPEEVQSTKQYMSEVGLHDNIKLGIMVETPAAVQTINEMCDEGIKFISFGTNDLTQFTLAIDRGNEDCQPLFNEMHPAILRQIAHVIKICKARGVETSICGQAGSRKEMAKFLVKQGIDSISVNADAAGELSEYIAELEKNHNNLIEISEKPAELINEKGPNVSAAIPTDENDEQVEPSALPDNGNNKIEQVGIEVSEEREEIITAEPIDDYSEYKIEVSDAVIETVREYPSPSTQNKMPSTHIETTQVAVETSTAKNKDFEDEVLEELTKETPEEETKKVLLDIF